MRQQSKNEIVKDLSLTLKRILKNRERFKPKSYNNIVVSGEYTKLLQGYAIDRKGNRLFYLNIKDIDCPVFDLPDIKGSIVSDDGITFAFQKHNKYKNIIGVVASKNRLS